MKALQGYRDLLAESIEEGAGTREVNRLREIIASMERGTSCRNCGIRFSHGEAPDGLCGTCRTSDPRWVVVQEWPQLHKSMSDREFLAPLLIERSADA